MQPPRNEPGSTGHQLAKVLALLGRRAHSARIARQFKPHRNSYDTSLSRLIDVILPWTIRTYPGYRLAFSRLLGVSEVSVYRLLSGRQRLTVAQCDRLIEFAATRIAQLQAIHLALVAERAETERRLLPGAQRSADGLRRAARRQAEAAAERRRERGE